MKKAFIFLLALITVFSVCACGESKGNEKTMDYNTTNPVVEMEIEGYGVIAIELYPEIAPNTVNNFISLVKNGFYDNNTFHRCYAGFVLQGGDPTATGGGHPGYSIKGEFTSNGFKNDLLHTEGVVSMARATPKDSAGSQFFIMLGDAPHLDGDYAAFGKVIKGLDIVKQIEIDLAPYANYNGMLIESKILTLKKAYVDTHGVDYPEPEKLPRAY